MNGDTLSVERLIAAPADRIFALLADAARHSEIDGSGHVQGTKAGSEPLTLGSRFGMSMKRGLPYTTSNEVIEFEPDRRIAWRTSGLFGLIGGRIWRYELVSQGTSTIVTETWDISKEKSKLFVRAAAKKTRANMEATLARIDEIVTAPE